jgi:hypothetical protein
LEYLLILAGLGLWLVYTRLFGPLSSIHATLPACPFFVITGHPCPLCGGTRAYAAMWQGDLAAAARHHPLGPALFAATLGAMLVLAAGAALGRRLSLQLTGGAYAVIGLAFLLSWTLKLVWLGN